MMFMIQKGKQVILFCNCSAGMLSEERKLEVKDKIKSTDAYVLTVSDLCAASISDKDLFRQLNENESQVTVVACFPRAVENLLRQNGVSLNNMKVLNMREMDGTAIREALIKEHGFSEGTATHEEVVSDLEVPGWYPVIDYSRCNHCGKCFRFCLFGVYSFSEKKLKVVSPLSCKNNCPACGRNCPSNAIIFPRVKEGGYLAGADVSDNPSAADESTGQTLLTTLQQRSATRNNIFRQGMLKMAIAEREKAIREIQTNTTSQHGTDK
jgi:NAD-dependent dihydropyrimidine dehydrogenase PreA subunit